jgi:hypothetical protein
VLQITETTRCSWSLLDDDFLVNFEMELFFDIFNEPKGP